MEEIDIQHVTLCAPFLLVSWSKISVGMPVICVKEECVREGREKDWYVQRLKMADGDG